MSSPPTPLVLSPTSIAALPPTSVADHRGVFDYVSLFSAPETNTKDLTVGIATLPVGKGQLGTHRHPQTEVYYILQGEGVVRLDGEETGVEVRGRGVFDACVSGWVWVVGGYLVLLLILIYLQSLRSLPLPPITTS
jgi:hypothetical protein